MSPHKKPNTALLVIDVQNDVVGKAYLREQVIANIAALVQRARAGKIPVIWVQHANEEMKVESEGWQIVPELKPLDGEKMIFKKHGDAFEDTGLGSELEALNVGRLIVTGAQTEACIRATLHGSFVRGYDTVLVADAHTTEDMTEYGLPAPEKLVSFTNIYWRWQTGPGREASVEKASEVRLILTR